jgi:hypothetical protein
MQNNRKYIIIDPQDGIFLGTAKNEDVNFMDAKVDDRRLIALFSINNMLGITKAVGFFKKSDAYYYMDVYIKERYPEAFVAEVHDELEGPYVDTISIVKSGYGEYAWDMIDEIPYPSQLVH